MQSFLEGVDCMCVGSHHDSSHDPTNFLILATTPKPVYADRPAAPSGAGINQYMPVAPAFGQFRGAP